MDNITQLKAKYGTIYKTISENIPIIFRALSAWELQALNEVRENKTAEDADLAVCLMGILDPTPLPDFKLPGTVSSIAAQIMAKSIYDTNEDLAVAVNKAREWATSATETNFNVSIAAIIAKLLPSTDILALLELPTSKLIRIGALVETITQTRFLTGETPQKQSPQAGQITPEDGASAALKTAMDKLNKRQ